MARNGRRPSEPGRPLSIRAIVLGGVLIGVVGTAAVAALLYFYGGGTPRDQAGLDVVRTAGTLVVGTGGAVALLLAARRQRSTELTLEHQREVAAITARDAVEQRITELYTRAVDQLGSSQAPVRLGGLHALERLAQNNPIQRQTVVDVLCAYLRMPYTPPGEEPVGEDISADVHSRYEQRRQELQVRLTAQHILAAHLNSDTNETFWPDVDLDLSEAQLHSFNLAKCHIGAANFTGAQFAGDVGFEGAQFAGNARFDGAQFAGNARLVGAWFSGYAGFDRAWFSGEVGFDGAQFAGEARFDGARFPEYARFDGVQFSRNASFDEAQFSRNASFDEAQFSGNVRFNRTQFSGDVRFNRARVRVAEDLPFVWPASWTTREAQEGEEEGWLYLVKGDGSTER